MIIIGEKINGSIPSIAKAIAERDADLIKARAEAQEAASEPFEKVFLDCCASVPEEEEVETLKWMIDCIQEVSDLPIAVDSPSARVLAEAYKFCNKPGLINSVSMEGAGEKIDILFPIIAANPGWDVAALCCDDTGIPKTAADRLRVFHDIMERAKEYGIAPNRMHIDPLIEMLCTSEDGIAMNKEVITTIREEYPDIHITAAISNISFNLPVRKILNQTFTVLCMEYGLDSAIVDPCNRDMVGTILAAEAMLGLDEYCMEYIGAYREGLFGPVK
ncbi:MAG: dihydropteroate synthase [Lachnospiraceae bacterium]|nr:dihydropteroate synthase [Lachnospiraceae bacterium]